VVSWVLAGWLPAAALGRQPGWPLPPLADRQAAAHAPRLVAEAARQAAAAAAGVQAGLAATAARCLPPPSVSAAADPMQI